jgi:small subunit ribosomal protein S8
MDTIADFLIRIKNGYRCKKDEVVTHYSAVNEKIAKILVDNGYLKEAKVEKTTSQKKKIINLTLKYEGKKPALSEIKRMSRPALRIYVKKTKIPQILGGLGLAIISTPKGLLTDSQAREKGEGGELICEVY